MSPAKADLVAMLAGPIGFVLVVLGEGPAMMIALALGAYD